MDLHKLKDIKPKIIRGKNGKYRGKSICDDIICFDIEDTSYYIENNKPIMYDYNRPEYMATLPKGSLCYHWQLSYNDIVFTARTLEEFKDFLFLLNIKCRARKIIYIHNFSHEFQFLLNIFTFDDIFARQSHKPLTAYIEKYNVEFRCSYMLTRLSLSTWGENLPVHKLKGDLDYDKLRTPLTPLSNKEIQYCINDVLVMYHGILKFKNKYGSVYNIPLTQTGEVRRPVKKLLSTDTHWLEHCRSLLPSNINEFKELLCAFMGGTVISNILYKNTTVSNILMYDIASSYPWVMLSEKYPIEKFHLIKPIEYDKYMDNPLYAYLIHFTASDVNSVTNCRFLSKSKCIRCDNCISDNGRVVRSTELELILTNVDFNIFKKCYSFNNLNIISLKISKTAYLPIQFRKYILELYNNKSTLKNVVGKEELYMQSKQYINSLYGMMVTKEISDDITFEHNEWQKSLLTEELFNDKISIKSKSLSKNFLSFQFGVWVTAYARNNLWKAILELDDLVVYCDTDSVKYINERNTNFFIKYNENVYKNYKILSKQLNVDESMFYPTSPNGKKCYIGIYECENPIINDNIIPINEFKTLGAKKYIYRDPVSNRLLMTVAGVSKKAVSCLNDNIENFKKDFTFTTKMLKDADCVKLTPYYLNNIDKVTFNDGYTNNYKYGICLMPTTYNLDISVSDLLLLREIIENVETKIFRSVNRTYKENYNE